MSYIHTQYYEQYKKDIHFSLTLLFSLSISANDELPEIEYDKFTLPNGLRVIVHEDRKIPVVAVNVWYHVGSKDELPGKTGFAHLFEHLMFNGTENYNNEYFAPFQKVGATDMNGTTNNDRTNYFQKCTYHCFGSCLMDGVRSHGTPSRSG